MPDGLPTDAEVFDLVASRRLTPREGAETLQALDWKRDPWGCRLRAILALLLGPI